MHWMAGRLAGTDARFKKEGEQVSAHYGIGGDGTIHQYVDEANTAYHAGDFPANQESVGIEHEGGPDIPITDSVYNESAKLIKGICARHGLPLERSSLRKHNEFKPTQCPGTLDLDRIIKLAKQEQEGPVDQQLSNFKSDFITVTGNWPTDDQVKRWRDSGKQTYTFVQDEYLNPMLADKDKQISDLKSQNGTLQQKVDKLTKDLQVEVDGRAEDKRKSKELLDEVKGDLLKAQGKLDVWEARTPVDLIVLGFSKLFNKKGS
jgi:hypothetical protein